MAKEEIITTTHITIPQQFRDPQTWISPAVRRTALPDEHIRFRLVMQAADATDSSITVHLVLQEFSPTEGWLFVTGGPWRCGVILDENGVQLHPQIGFHPSQLRPDATDIRYEISWTQRLRLGAVIESFIDV